MTRTIVVALIAFVIGYLIGESNQPINITGRIVPNLLSRSSDLTIQFNGYETISGKLDRQGNGHAVGTWDGKPVSALCSSQENRVVCNVEGESINTQISFEKNQGERK